MGISRNATFFFTSTSLCFNKYYISRQICIHYNMHNRLKHNLIYTVFIYYILHIDTVFIYYTNENNYNLSITDPAIELGKPMVRFLNLRREGRQIASPRFLDLAVFSERNGLLQKKNYNNIFSSTYILYCFELLFFQFISLFCTFLPKNKYCPPNTLACTLLAPKLFNFPAKHPHN
jgi:hypothetical protein